MAAIAHHIQYVSDFFFQGQLIVHQYEARSFVRLLHCHGITYTTVAQWIGEHPPNFSQWLIHSRDDNRRCIVGEKVMQWLNRVVNENPDEVDERFWWRRRRLTAEKAAHDRLKARGRHYSGEWFEGTKTDIITEVQQAIQSFRITRWMALNKSDNLTTYVGDL